MEEAKETLLNITIGDARSSVTGSNLQIMIRDCLAKLSDADKNQCDPDQLLEYLQRDPSGPCCRTAEDVEHEVAGDKGEQLKKVLVDKGIASASFVDALIEVAKNTR